METALNKREKKGFILRSGMSFPTTLPVEGPFGWNVRPKCPQCGAEMKEGEIHPRKVRDGYCYTWWCSAPDCLETHAHKYQPSGNGGNVEITVKMLKSYGVDSFFAESTLDTFQGNPPMVSEAKKYAENPEGILLICGATGRGKTHLAIGIMRAVLAAGKRNIFFRYIPDLMTELKETFDRGRETWITEKDVIDRYCGYDFLVLDDLGVEKSTDYAIQAIEGIIDNRIRNCRPTAVTTNLSPADIDEQIDPRLASRLASGRIWTLKGEDWRKKR